MSNLPSRRRSISTVTPLPTLTAVATLLVGVAAAACGGGDSGADAAPSSGSAGAAGAAGAAGGSGGAAAGAGGGAMCVDTGERPSPRSEMMGGFDAKRGRLVFFGGDDGLPKQCNPAPHQVDEVWSLDVACAGFTRATSASGPGARARGAAAIDGAHDRLLVFGGRSRSGDAGPYTVYGDLWSLDLATLAWTKLETTGGGPSARSSAAAVVDPVANELVVFGGNTSTNGAAFAPKDDVWTLALDTLVWTQRQPGTGPKARLFHAAAVDAKTGRVFVHGGGGANAFQGPFYGDLWQLSADRTTWTQLSNGTGDAPKGRISADLAFDDATGRVLLFGGHDDGDVGNNNDTWAFDVASASWTAIVAPETVQTTPAGFCAFPKDFTKVNLSAPDRRSAHVAGYDATARKLVLFGGKTDCGLIDDAWWFSAETGQWSRSVKALSGEACVRRDHPDQCTSLCL